MTRDEFDKTRLRLMFSGICPACGSPIAFEAVRRLSLRCANPHCQFWYQPSLAELEEVAPAQEDRPGPARLPIREA
jgi:hypothetical protein